MFRSRGRLSYSACSSSLLRSTPGSCSRSSCPRFRTSASFRTCIGPSRTRSAILVVSRVARRVDQAPILLVAIAMLGLSFVAFAAFPHTVWNYLLIDTLLLGACGINDLFWWEHSRRNAGLRPVPRAHARYRARRECGGRAGGQVPGRAAGNSRGSSSTSALAGMAVVCLALILLPPLHRELSRVVRKNTFLVSLTNLPPEEQQKDRRAHRLRIGAERARERNCHASAARVPV